MVDLVSCKLSAPERSRDKTMYCFRPTCGAASKISKNKKLHELRIKLHVKKCPECVRNNVFTQDLQEGPSLYLSMKPNTKQNVITKREAAIVKSLATSS